ncbi:MAG: DUF3300 domain-containing protein [Akkermansiaceae bacterium]|nr:DUF3300 domain-containing protein [Akkermansiaceae bacterium]
MRFSPTPCDLQPIRQIAALLIIAGMFTSTPGLAQTAPAPPSAVANKSAVTASSDPGASVARISAGEAGYAMKSMDQLEEMVAPVALYPDELLAQILPASTRPLDVVKAHQFLQREPDFQELPAEATENWDPAVVSLLQFKEVVAMMAGDIDWTVALGEAFYFQEGDVYDAIQLVRTRADAKGLLTGNQHQVYVKETEIIRIEPADPEVIYVPKYNPQVIYVNQAAPGPDPFLTFVAGVAVVWGLSWAFDWRHRKCVHHHHWDYPWHHHHYHSHYGYYYHGGKPPKPPSYRPPVHPPRPPGWRPPGQRPPGYLPPRPTQPIAHPPGYRPDRPGTRPPGDDNSWRPSRPPVTSPPDRPGNGRPPLAGADRPTQLPSARPPTPGTLPTQPSTRPTQPSTRPTQPSTRPTQRPSTPTTRPGTPSQQPGSTFGPSTRQSAPATRNASDRDSSSINRSSGATRPTSGYQSGSSFLPQQGGNRASSRGAASSDRRKR